MSIGLQLFLFKPNSVIKSTGLLSPTLVHEKPSTGDILWAKDKVWLEIFPVKVAQRILNPDVSTSSFTKVLFFVDETVLVFSTIKCYFLWTKTSKVSVLLMCDFHTFWTFFCLFSSWNVNYNHVYLTRNWNFLTPNQTMASVSTLLSVKSQQICLRPAIAISMESTYLWRIELLWKFSFKSGRAHENALWK